MKLATYSHARSADWSAPAGDLDSDRTLVIAFAGSERIDDADWLAGLRTALPRATLVGCSTAGEICGTRIADGSVALAVARFDEARVRSVTVPAPPGVDSAEAGRRLAHALVGDGLRAVIVLSDGLNVNGSELVRGLNAALPDDVVVTGGLAGDGDRFERTWVLTPEGPKAGHIVAVGLYGHSLVVGHGSKGGWDIFGPERTVTRSKANVLYELDGKPALRLYKEYLGDRAEGLPATGLLFPLSIRPARGDDRRLVRTVLAVDERDQSLTFAGDVPEGALAQLMRANFDRLVDGAVGAAVQAVTPAAPSPLLSIAISCVGRRLVLGERAEEETEATLDVLPEGTHQVGFYSYGEISPLASGRCELHNQTMTLTTIGER